jgi:hypothetical protein
MYAQGAVAFADIGRQTQKSAQIDVTVDLRLDRIDCDATGGRVINNRGRQAPGQRVEQPFAGVWRRVLAEQNRRLAGIDDEALGIGTVRLKRAGEFLDVRAGLFAAESLVRKAEVELCDLGIRLHGVDYFEQGGNVDAVHKCGPLNLSCS